MQRSADGAVCKSDLDLDLYLIKKLEICFVKVGVSEKERWSRSPKKMEKRWKIKSNWVNYIQFKKNKSKLNKTLYLYR